MTQFETESFLSFVVAYGMVWALGFQVVLFVRTQLYGAII
jgi:hypothetical protein